MELIRGIHNILPKHRHCVMTIGKFDGVHLGHKTLINKLKDEGKKRNLPVVVMIFEPQPLEFIAPQLAPVRLTPFREKFKYLAELGIDYLLCVRFNQAFSQFTASQFVSTLLMHKLGVHYLLVGSDFRFGKDRLGDIEFLQHAANIYHFSVEIATMSYFQHEKISSTAIRQALSQSDFVKAQALLGRPYSISGRVIYGKALGRTLGFPTANIALNWNKPLLRGVFAATVNIDGCTYFGVANLGNRPTLSESTFLLEVHLLNLNVNLYGKHIEVTLCKKIRDEQKFASLEALTQQITADVITTKEFFNIVQ